jgi:hypothetical protein
VSAAPARDRSPAGSQAAAEWEQIRQAAPALAAVMLRYLTRAAAFLAPRSVDVADAALRQLSRFLLADTVVRRVADISRDDIEDYKVWLSGQPASREAPCRPTPTGSGCGPCGRSSSGSSSGTGPKPRPATPSWAATSPRSPSRCLSSSTTATPPG